MNRVEVKSSYIDSIGYDDGILEVAYKDGKVYKYDGVSADLYKSVMDAESIGKVLQEQVLKGGFTTERVEKEE